MGCDGRGFQEEGFGTCALEEYRAFAQNEAVFEKEGGKLMLQILK